MKVMKTKPLHVSRHLHWKLLIWFSFDLGSHFIFPSSAFIVFLVRNGQANQGTVARCHYNLEVFYQIFKNSGKVWLFWTLLTVQDTAITPWNWTLLTNRWRWCPLTVSSSPAASTCFITEIPGSNEMRRVLNSNRMRLKPYLQHWTIIYKQREWKKKSAIYIISLILACPPIHQPGLVLCILFKLLP